MKKQPGGVYKIEDFDFNLPTYKNGYIGKIESINGVSLRNKNPTKTFIGGLVIGIIIALPIATVIALEVYNTIHAEQFIQLKNMNQ